MAVGSSAPDFTLYDQHKSPVVLSSFRGHKNVVLVFYPWAFTRVCGSELFAIQQQLAWLQDEAVQVLTVSVDSVYAHRVWAEHEGFEFPLLSDFWPHGGVAESYGVFDAELGNAVRGTFIIDREGIVRWSIVNEVPDGRDLTDYRAALAAL